MLCSPYVILHHVNQSMPVNCTCMYLISNWVMTSPNSQASCHDGRQGEHVSQCCGMGEEENAGQSMKCFGIRHWKKGVETDACCVLVVGLCVDGMENERMEIGGVPWLRGDGTSLMVHAPIVLIMPA